MSKTHFKKVIEQKAEGLKVSHVENKEIDQRKDDGTIEKIKYKKVKCTYDHPNGGGQPIRGRPMFLTPSFEHPRGIKLDNRKLTGFVTFDEEENEDVKLFISDKASTQSKGWVNETDVKTTIKGGKSYAKAISDGVLKTEASNESAENYKYTKGELMGVEDEKEVDEETWLLVTAGGTEGFFDCMKTKISELLANDKRTGLSNEKPEEIYRRIRNPIYRAIDPETGKLVQGKKPSAFFKVSYFAANPKENKKESFGRYQVPGLDNCLDLETMKKSALKIKSAVLMLVDVYIGAGKIIPQYYITDAVVVDISEIKMPNILEDEMKSMSENELLVAKLKKQLAASKKFETPSPSKETSNKEALVEEDNDTTTFDDLISNEPKKSSVVENLEPTIDEDVEIPGLP